MNPEVTKTRKKKKRRTRFLFLLGLVLCAYPLISSIYERQHQQSAVATYQKEIEKIDTNKLDQELADAKKYNEMLWQLHGIVVDSIQEDVLSESNYNSLLNFSSSLYGMMGTLSIPKISVNLPIYHGTSDEVLNNGVGHLQESSLPIGGENTHCILTGHRGLPNSKLFTRLDELDKGDLFFLEVCNQKLAYQVKEITVIEPEDVENLQIQEGKDLVSLVTCTPYGINTHRLVVTGERIEYKESTAKNVKAELMSFRELFFTALPFLFIGYAAFQIVKSRRKMKRETKQILQDEED